MFDRTANLTNNQIINYRCDPQRNGSESHLGLPRCVGSYAVQNVAVKVANVELYYKAVHFHLEEHPDLINDLLNVLALCVDHMRVVDIMRKAGHLRLVKPYMVAVQSNNVAAVNEALNEIYVEEEDYERLWESVDLHNSFDQIGLMQKLEKHALLELRRIAAYIYKKVGRWKQSVALSKDNLYKDAMETCSQSGYRELSEELFTSLSRLCMPRYFLHCRDLVDHLFLPHRWECLRCPGCLQCPCMGCP